MSALTAFMQHSAGGPSLFGKARKETKHNQIEKEVVKLSIQRGHGCQ